MASCPMNRQSVEDGINKVEIIGPTALTYPQYLQLDTLLSCQVPVGKDQYGEPVHDEHLFIVTHQTYELWFKQVIIEIDSIRHVYMKSIFDESKMLLVISRLNRVVVILKLLAEQIMILETMTPLDFMDFRDALEPASGFQSLQFRLLENKIGVRNDMRVRYNQQYYCSVFNDDTSKTAIQESEKEPSLLELVELWLERTPGLERNDDNDFVFFDEYIKAANKLLEEQYLAPAMNEKNEKIKELKMEDYRKQLDALDNIVDINKYNECVKKGERNLSHRAFQGALMIALYRDEPRFSQPFHLLTLLMDMDALLTKWRYNHVLLVQRMLGTKIGTGGSSGYQYLRSTVSDRYKPFVDLFNLSTYLIPRSRIPPLSDAMKKSLSIIMTGRSDT